MARRKHGKRSVIGRIAKVRAAVIRAERGIIERDVKMELAHAILALRQAAQFVRNAERLAARTL